ncbi:caprin homolog isoform X2 [Toxorhynchites rutilus septentrionalis]|uniref:caprin homolog isoform X2 n=1 Tax=Toxorhynchites rutilus septentrionalis TaxID=329112 RepID=UPI00247A8411|nr:caprin homolog isoform X2 [Toxorhynchites rutilus septentrionalis]
MRSGCSFRSLTNYTLKLVLKTKLNSYQILRTPLEVLPNKTEMPSIKVLESNKISTPDSLNNAVETGGSDGYSSTKEVQPSQTMMNTAANNNGIAKEQPANPLQQIILIIEHKIRNLEKRKNKLESYKATEKAGKKLTGDQKIAVSKYDECLTSLELTRELCKQFQSIAAVANREAKKEAKRSTFVRAQQENAKIREVLTIQDVLMRLTIDTVRDDFLSGENGACKISEEDFVLLKKLREETQPKRPENTAEHTFVSSVKQAADHLSAVADGRNKIYCHSTYVHLKAVIGNIQECGYFEKDIVTVDEKVIDQAAENESLNEDDSGAVVEEIKTEENSSSSSSTKNDTSSSQIFAEAPAAAAVPTPSFPTQPNVMRQNVIPPASVPTGVCATNSAIITPSVPIPAAAIGTNSAMAPTSTTIVQPTAIILPTVIQPQAASIKPITGQQIGATTVQAVEHAYFKQHYIQQQMRPIHEVIGNSNFFFLQESEIDKPDIVSTPVAFGNSIPSNNTVGNMGTAHQAQQQQSQAFANQTSNLSILQSNQQVVAPQPSSINQAQQAATISVQPSSFNNQTFQNITTTVNTFNNSEQRQQSLPTNTTHQIQNKTSTVSKLNEHGHIPGFASCSTRIVSTQSVLQTAQNTLPMQQHQPSQNHAQPQLQSQAQQQSPARIIIQQGAAINSTYNSSIQQFPALIQGLHDSSSQGANNATQNLSTIIVDSTAGKNKLMNVSEKLPNSQTSHLNQSSQIPKQHHDGWNRGTDFGANLTKSDDQWSNNTIAISKTIEERSHDKGQYNLPRQSQQQSLQVISSNTSGTPNNESPVPVNVSRIQQNGSQTAGFGTSCNIQDASTTHGAAQQSTSIQQLHQTGQRNSRSASNAPFNQSNARFTNDGGMNNATAPFFKNNDRFYQQNQNNNLSSGKVDTTYHQRGPMIKSRSDSNGNPSSRSGAFGSMTGSNGTAGTNNGNTSGGIDYRSNARPVNSTRNTGPPSSRPHQRNHSGNGNYGGPRGGSNTRGQSTINA